MKASTNYKPGEQITWNAHTLTKVSDETLSRVDENGNKLNVSELWRDEEGNLWTPTADFYRGTGEPDFFRQYSN